MPAKKVASQGLGRFVHRCCAFLSISIYKLYFVRYYILNAAVILSYFLIRRVVMTEEQAQPLSSQDFLGFERVLHVFLCKIPHCVSQEVQIWFTVGLILLLKFKKASTMEKFLALLFTYSKV